MKLYPRIALLLISLAIFSCSDWGDHFNDKHTLATVGDKALNIEDIDALFFANMGPEDSAKLLESYVDVWVKKQLKIAEAERLFEMSQEDIDRKVEEYRNSLLTYRIDQHHIDNSLDTAFTEEEISAYYNDNRSDFVLDAPMVRGLMVKFPSNFRQASQLRTLIGSSKSDDKQDFLELCDKNGLEYMNILQWTAFDEALNFLPTRKDYDYGYIMSDNKVHEFTDGENKYYVFISESLAIGDAIPIDQVSSIIKRIIFNSRKESIVRSHEDSLMSRGLREGVVELFINKEY